MKNLIYISIICATIFCCNAPTVFGQTTFNSSGSVSFGDPILNSEKIPDRFELPIILHNVPAVGAISLGIKYNPNMFQLIGSSIPASGLFLMGYEKDAIKIAWLAPINFTSIAPGIFDTLTSLKFRYMGTGCDKFSFIDDKNYEITDIKGNPYNIVYGDNIEICVPLSTGINDNEAENINIFSSNNIIYIQNTDYKYIEIYDVLGRIVHKDTLIINQNNSFELDKEGIFIVKLTSSTNSITKKIRL